MSTEKKNTIADVARQAGTSTATVSRVLNDTDYPISRELRDRVVQAALALGYRPDLTDRLPETMREQQEIGIVLPSISNPFYADLMSAVEKECVQRSYAPVLCLSHNSGKLETRHIQMLRQKHVAGILISCVHMDDSFMKLLQGLEMPCVLFDQTYEEYSGLNVGFDFYRGAYMATRYLLQCGHRDIVFATDPMDRRSRSRRLEGYKAALREAEIRFSPKRVLVSSGADKAYPVPAEFRSGYELGQMLLDCECFPDAVVAMNDSIAIGIIQCLKAHNICIPADISIIGFDNIDISGMIEPALTTIDQRSYEMGQRAARMLLDGIEQVGKPMENVAIQPQLIERRSVRKVYKRHSRR